MIPENKINELTESIHESMRSILVLSNGKLTESSKDVTKAALRIAYQTGNNDGFKEGFALGQKSVTQTMNAINSLLKPILP